MKIDEIFGRTTGLSLREQVLATASWAETRRWTRLNGRAKRWRSGVEALRG
jgi:hypothetical protein